MSIKFKKMNSIEIRNSMSYIISTTILNMSDEFTMNDIIAKIIPRLHTYIGCIELDELKNAIYQKLDTLTNIGWIIHYGYSEDKWYKVAQTIE